MRHHGHTYGCACGIGGDRGGRRHRAQARRATIGAVLLLPYLVLAGCGNVTAGGVGETDVYMTGDAGAQPAPSSGPSRAVVEDPGQTRPAPAVAVVGGLEGDLDVAASFFLRSLDGTLVPLGPASVTLDLAGALEPRVARAPVPAGSYDALTIRFTDVTADVTGGLEIDGFPFSGIVEVDLGGPSLDVTRPLALVVEDDAVEELLVDLNADVWIPLLDVVTSVVATEDFAAAVAVRER